MSSGSYGTTRTSSSPFSGGSAASGRPRKDSNVSVLVPGFEDSSRTANIFSAICGLVATIIGGSALSLPYAFSKSGVLLCSLFVVVIAASSDFSVYLLITLSRRSGLVTYEAIAERAFGPRAKLFTALLIVTLLFLAIVAYLLLQRDLIISLLEFAFSTTFSPLVGRLEMLVVVLLTLPFCLLRSLSGLRFTSAASICAVVLLTCTIVMRAVQRLRGDGSEEAGRGATAAVAAAAAYPMDSVKFVTHDFHDAIYSLPFICVTYVCHFNVLSVHSELREPTRPRIKTMIHWVIGICTTLYLLIGAAGYIFALDETRGNILNNFRADDPVISVGRAALACVVILSLPLLVQPCRNSLDRVLAFLGLAVEADEHEYEAIPDAESGAVPIAPTSSASGGPGPSSRAAPAVAAAAAAAGKRSLFASLFGTDTGHIVKTLCISGGAIVVALFVPSVATIWSIAGSTVALFIAFILPAACYIKLRAHKPLNRLKIAAWALIVCSCCLCVICTAQSVSSLLSAPPSKLI